MDIKDGNTTTEWKIVLMNYVVGLALLGAGLFLEYKGKDSTELMTLAVGFLTLNGIGYGTLRTVHKNTAVKVAADVAVAKTPEVPNAS